MKMPLSQSAMAFSKYAGQMNDYIMWNQPLIHIYLPLRFSANDILMCAEYVNERTNKRYECCI